MRKPRGGQILANRVIGPREVLGGGDRRVPAKGRGRTEPHRGRSGASWIWSTPLHTGASEGEFRSGYALTPSPSHSKNISLFTERRTSERTVSEDGYSSFLFNPLWGFPVVAAGILFVVDPVIYTSDGAFQRYLFLPRNPDLVLVDTDIIARAPVRFLVAGMGDALATWFEADSCRRSSSHNVCGGLGTRAAYTLARLCYDTIMEHGISAMVACQQSVVTAALSHVVEANTLLSGLGFESGGLGAAHSIHNGLTRLSGTHHFYHGEKVAFGVLAGLFLTDRPHSTIEQVYDFCESVELPTTLSEIGIGEASEADLQKVAEGACQEGETIHNEAGTILPEMVSASLKAADGFGRLRKNLH